VRLSSLWKDQIKLYGLVYNIRRLFKIGAQSSILARMTCLDQLVDAVSMSFGLSEYERSWFFKLSFHLFQSSIELSQIRPSKITFSDSVLHVNKYLIYKLQATIVYTTRRNADKSTTNDRYGKLLFILF